MKLSELKALAARMQTHSKSCGVADPDVSFWLSTSVEDAVRADQRSMFIDTVPDTSEPVYTHRITSGAGYSIPLILKG
jgi:hypothetical protein